VLVHRCLAIIVLTEKLKNLHIAGFNQVGHFAYNNLLVCVAILPSKGILFLKELAWIV